MIYVIILSIVIVIFVLILTIIAISKGYAYEHKVDPLPTSEDQQDHDESSPNEKTGQ
ncbi:YtzI protein [Alkalibacillus aidingensis]|uniref:YtzI protein n=1 Tax=Alkalibacillus aidingensis TaxID=2747607 RepID=UPI00166131D6|nr:YtzI protein [Alkalibacillus aidingensis]